MAAVAVVAAAAAASSTSTRSSASTSRSSCGSTSPLLFYLSSKPGRPGCRPSLPAGLQKAVSLSGGLAATAFKRFMKVSYGALWVL